MNEKMKLIKEEFAGWKKWEVIWLAISCAVILGLSIYWKDTAIGIVCSITGVICVVMTGKGKLGAYFFGLINTILYAYISFGVKYYGEVMLNLLYYVPMQFYGYYIWKKHMNEDSHEVEKRSMNVKGLVLMLSIVALATVIYGTALKWMGGALSYVDALSTVVSVVAMYVSIKMYAEQWILWIIVDVVTVFMWAVAFVNRTDSIATLLMWIVYLANAIIMYMKWKKEAKSNV